MSKKILIVDDNETIRTLLKMSLKKQNYEIIEATDGELGYEKAMQEKPDLIISDILMPRMDGFEFCRKVRESPVIPTVPFIFLTSLSEVSTEVRGYRTGADDYLVKSNLKKEELIGKVEMMLTRSGEYKKLESVMHEGLTGKLENLSMIEVVQLLGMNKKTGVLAITSKQQTGEVYFDEGRIVYSKCGDSLGEQSIYKMAEWSEGIFKFEPKTIDIEQNIATSTMNLIMEACRIMDEKKAKLGT
jgi:DNA-binding response OmpR family regulator